MLAFEVEKPMMSEGTRLKCMRSRRTSDNCSLVGPAGQAMEHGPDKPDSCNEHTFSLYSPIQRLTAYRGTVAASDLEEVLHTRMQ